MLEAIRPFFDHSRHTLGIRDLAASLDVLAFTGEESLSQPFSYTIEFTSSDRDIAADAVLGKHASFSLYAAPDLLPKFSFEPPAIVPLRTLHGVITAFKRLSGSRDEARYEVRLQPRLALLQNSVQYRLYQQQSVPEIVEQVLRRHGFEGQDFLFALARTYPDREQVMQYGESDLVFLQRLLAELGIWFAFVTDQRLGIEVVEFHDDSRHYQRGFSLPLRPQSGLHSNAADSVWDLQASHQVVQAGVFARAYNHRDAGVSLDGEVNLTRGADTTYGEAYHYADEPYLTLGDPYALGDEDGHAESGTFYARLAHERYLNNQTRLAGTSSSAALAPGEVLTIEGESPQAFTDGALIVQLTCTAARDRSFEVSFQAIPDSSRIGFRPEVPKKPSIAGTVPARVTSPQTNDPYGHIDREGRYKVQFLFDRDGWPAGRESLWLRLARPYAGDTHGLHLPLLAGTEVAVAFEQGDPDRPYIAHALHDSQHPDHVTLYNYKRNVLRTPANNKLRLDDERGKEHIKLSTEHSGKSQLNLGHLVDGQRQPRGEGMELRTDGHGAIRAGKGLFISADRQSGARGPMLDMQAAIDQLENALSLARSLATAARSGQSKPNDVDSQIRLNQALKELAQPGLLLHAPAGIGLASPEAVRMASGGESVGLMAGHNVDLSAGRDITATAHDAISLYAARDGLQLKAGHGKVELHAYDDALHAQAKTELKIESVEGRIEISAPQELLLHCGGAYIRIKDGEIEVGAPGNLSLKTAHVQKTSSSRVDTPPVKLPDGYGARYVLSDKNAAARPFARYRITNEHGDIFNGVTDKDGETLPVHTLLPGDLKIDFPLENKPAIRLVITNEPTGYTIQGLYGVGYAMSDPVVVVRTYRVRILELNEEAGLEVAHGEFNVTRDAWYFLGLHQDGKFELLNRAFVPADPARNLYGAFWIPSYPNKFGIRSELDAFVLTRFGERELPARPFRTQRDLNGNSIINPRENEGIATDVMIHVGGTYEVKGYDYVGGSLGCFAFIPQEDIYPSPELAKKASENDDYDDEASNPEWKTVADKIKKLSFEKSVNIQVLLENVGADEIYVPEEILSE